MSQQVLNQIAILDHKMTYLQREMRELTEQLAQMRDDMKDYAKKRGPKGRENGEIKTLN